MSGHSKWSKVKHQKASTDAAKGKIFTKMTNAIIIAVRETGGNTDPDSNFKLRLAIDKAKSANVPKANIERAIERGRGKHSDQDLTEAKYEGYGLAGVGLVIISITSNKKRSVAEIKNVLDRGGGSLAQEGAVSFMFDRVGKLEVQKGTKNFEEIFEIANSANALDIEEKNDTVIVYTKDSLLHKAKEEFSRHQINVTEAELVYKPNTYIQINQTDYDRLKILIDRLFDLEDVHKVFSNEKINLLQRPE